MIVGTLRTRILEKREPFSKTEGGFFEVEVYLDEALMQRSGDVKDYVYKKISVNLANAVRHTTVPVEYWTFEFSERMIQRYKFPEAVLNFGVS